MMTSALFNGQGDFCGKAESHALPGTFTVAVTVEDFALLEQRRLRWDINSKQLVPLIELTSAQENHLGGIKDRFCRQVDEKYRAGAAEHGGNLWDKTPLQLIDEAIQETIDQYTFLHTVRIQIVEALDAAKR